MFTKQETKEKKKRKNDAAVNLLLPHRASVPMNSGNYCSADQCFFNSHQAASPSSITPIPSGHSSTSTILFEQQTHDASEKNYQEQNIFSNATLEYTLAHEANTDFLSDMINSLAEILTPDLLEIIKKAATLGFFASALFTLSDDVITELLAARHYQPEKIYWINQVVRAAALIAMGAPTSITIGLPLINYFLTAYVGTSKDKANALTSGAVLATSMLTSPLKWIETSLVMATGVSTSLLGGQATKFAYHLARNSIFPAKKTIKDDAQITLNNKFEYRK